MTASTESSTVVVDYQLARHAAPRRRSVVNTAAPEASGVREVFAAFAVTGLVLVAAYLASEDRWVEHPGPPRAAPAAFAMAGARPEKSAPGEGRPVRTALGAGAEGARR